jgi:hypothetical protein
MRARIDYETPPDAPLDRSSLLDRSCAFLYHAHARDGIDRSFIPAAACAFSKYQVSFRISFFASLAQVDR